MEAMVNTSHVDVVETIEILGFCLEHIADMGYARIVDQDIEAGQA
jgi:hypothetical protein